MRVRDNPAHPSVGFEHTILLAHHPARRRQNGTHHRRVPHGSRPNTSAWSSRSSTRSVHANANAIHAPTSGPTRIWQPRNRRRWKLRDVSRRGFVRRRERCSVKCASSLNSRAPRRAGGPLSVADARVVVKLLGAVEEKYIIMKSAMNGESARLTTAGNACAREARKRRRKTRGWKNRRRTCCGTRRGRRSTRPLWSATPCPQARTSRVSPNTPRLSMPNR